MSIDNANYGPDRTRSQSENPARTPDAARALADFVRGNGHSLPRSEQAELVHLVRRIRISWDYTPHDNAAREWHRRLSEMSRLAISGWLRQCEVHAARDAEGRDDA
jgi:hypothetical protein